MVNCAWEDFGEWSECSASCGGGTRTRTRVVSIPSENGGDECTGDATETENCETQECPAGSKK